MRSLILTCFVVAGCAAATAVAETPAERGYRHLSTKAYLPPRLDDDLFDRLWQEWELPLRMQAEKATRDERRQMAFRRYGLTPPAADQPALPDGQVQYVVDKYGDWTMSCFACHQGEVAGQVIAGVPNTRFAMQTLSEDIRNAKLREKDELQPADIGSLVFPEGGSIGTTNAVMFGVVLKHYRDAELNVHANRPRPKLTHHDMDAPAWWHFKKKKRLYIDGFAPKTPRALMPFLLVRENGPEEFRRWEKDFQDIYAWLESLEAPKYPFAIDQELAAQGRETFNQSCADCHGTYGDEETYPERLVPWSKVKTDRVRLDALTVAHREGYGESWFAQPPLKELPVMADPKGYVAPPLDGIWASAPYLHNGSVPTLWHLLRSEQRPTVWRRATQQEQAASKQTQQDGYDRSRVGLAVVELKSGPGILSSSAGRRHFFDTSGFGKSAAGHTFPDDLTEAEKRALLEYLKTL